MPEPLVVDANPIISALLGGAAREVIFSGKFTLYSTQHTLFEVEKYIPFMARKLGRRELDLLREFELLPVIACQPNQYDSRVEEANLLIARAGPKGCADPCADPGTWISALDRDFDGIPAISVRRTADLGEQKIS